MTSGASKQRTRSWIWGGGRIGKKDWKGLGREGERKGKEVRGMERDKGKGEWKLGGSLRDGIYGE